MCIGPGPDRLGPKTEKWACRGPRTGPDLDRSWTGPDWEIPGPDRSRPGLLQNCLAGRPELWHGRVPWFLGHGRAGRGWLGGSCLYALAQLPCVVVPNFLL